MSLYTFASGCRLVIAAILLYSGLAKARRAHSEVSDLLQGIGVAHRSGVFAAKALPIIEILVALWLVSGLNPIYSLTIAAILLSLFSVVVTLALRKGYEGGCGCFGKSSNLGLHHLLLNSALLAIGSFALILSFSTPSVDKKLLSVDYMLDSLAAVMIGVVLAAIYVLGERMVRLSKVLRRGWL